MEKVQTIVARIFSEIFQSAASDRFDGVQLQTSKPSQSQLVYTPETSARVGESIKNYFFDSAISGVTVHRSALSDVDAFYRIEEQFKAIDSIQAGQIRNQWEELHRKIIEEESTQIRVPEEKVIEEAKSREEYQQTKLKEAGTAFLNRFSEQQLDKAANVWIHPRLRHEI